MEGVAVPDVEEVAKVVVYVRAATWKRLNDRKSRGVSFDDVITELLDEAEARK